MYKTKPILLHFLNVVYKFPSPTILIIHFPRINLVVSYPDTLDKCSLWKIAVRNYFSGLHTLDNWYIWNQQRMKTMNVSSHKMVFQIPLLCSNP